MHIPVFNLDTSFIGFPSEECSSEIFQRESLQRQEISNSSRQGNLTSLDMKYVQNYYGCGLWLNYYLSSFAIQSKQTAGSLKDLWQVRMRVIQNCEKAPKETVSQKRNMTCMQCTWFYSISFPQANQRNVRRFSRPCSGDEMRWNL